MLGLAWACNCEFGYSVNVFSLFKQFFKYTVMVILYNIGLSYDLQCIWCCRKYQKSTFCLFCVFPDCMTQRLIFKNLGLTSINKLPNSLFYQIIIISCYDTNIMIYSSKAINTPRFMMLGTQVFPLKHSDFSLYKLIDEQFKYTF